MTDSGRYAAAFVVAVAVAGAAAQAPAPVAPAGAQLAIASPDDDAYLSGPVVLRAEVRPDDAASAVSFFVDGRQVCVVTKRPYECEYDAGPTVSAHTIRIVATLEA